MSTSVRFTPDVTTPVTPASQVDSSGATSPQTAETETATTTALPVVDSSTASSIPIFHCSISHTSTFQPKSHCNVYSKKQVHHINTESTVQPTPTRQSTVSSIATTTSVELSIDSSEMNSLANNSSTSSAHSSDSNIVQRVTESVVSRVNKSPLRHPLKQTSSSSNLSTSTVQLHSNAPATTTNGQPNTGSSGGEYTVYHLRVQCVTPLSTHQWETQRRYSEFLSMHQFICKHPLFHATANGSQTVKQLKHLFPKKSFVKKSEKVVQQRKTQFSDYLVMLMNFFNNEELLNSTKIKSSTDYESRNQLVNCIFCFLDIDSAILSHHFQHRNATVPHLIYYDKLKIQKRNLWIKLRELEHQMNQSLLDQQRKNAQLMSAPSIHSSNLTLDEKQQKFYSKNFRLMHKYHDQIKNLTLEGDLFAVYKRSQACLIFNISSFSRIYIFPMQDIVPFKSAQELSTQSPYLFETVLYHQMSGAGKKSYPIHFLKDFQKLPHTFQPNGNESMRLNWKDGTSTLFYSHNRTDIAHCLSVHVKRFQKNRTRLIQHLRECLGLKRTSYDMSNEQHEKMLLNLWDTVFPDVPLTDRKSKQWSQIGFQSEPSTDFRGAGVGALHFLTYCASNYTKQFRYIIDEERDYPLCVAGINVIEHCFRLLGVQDWDDMRADDPRWDELPLFNFLVQQYVNTTHPLEEFTCFFLFLLDHVFVQEDASYFAFGEILDKTKKKVMEAIEDEDAVSFRVLYEKCFTPEHLRALDVIKEDRKEVSSVAAQEVE